jgi:hypothetical protein
MADKETKIVRSATRIVGRRWCKATVELTKRDGKLRLSIVGEEGPYAFGKYIVHSAGQIVDTMAKFFPELKPLLPYHLNDMHAECEHQRKLGWTWATHPGAPCPTCGYKLGHGWKYQPLPAAIVKKAKAFGTTGGGKRRHAPKQPSVGKQVAELNRLLSR